MFSRSSNHGFALLITITLLAFLVLLLVSLSSLTRVETTVIGNSQQITQARENALLALNIAIGQLQKDLGPDQRTTMRADMLDPNNVNGAPFTTLPKPGLSRWIAAIGNGNSANYTDTPSSIPVNATTGSVNAPIILNWLVSGNEDATFTAQSDGHISSPSSSSAANASLAYVPTGGITFNPSGSTDAQNLTDTNLSALSTDVTISNQSGTAMPAQLLIGPHSAASAEAAYATTDSGGTTYAAAGSSSAPTSGGSDYVFAPKVPITAPASSVPGMGSGTTSVTIGNYAYWVGDENMKARANLTDNYLQQNSTSLQSPFYQWLVNIQGRANTVAGLQRATSAFSAYITQHDDLGFMDQGATSLITTNDMPNASASSTLIAGDFNYNNYSNYSLSLPATAPSTAVTYTFSSPLGQLVADGQLPMLATSNPLNGSSTAITSSTTRLQAALSYRFHDISAYSYSVLADSYAGGLKKDIGAALAPGVSTSDTADATPLFTVQSGQDFVNSSTWSAVPTWGQLRSYFSKRSSLTGLPYGDIAVQRNTPTQMGFHPSLVYAALGFSLFRDAAGHLYVAFYPYAALFNPYPGTIVGNSNGDPLTNDQLGFSFRNSVTIELDLLDASGNTTSAYPIDLTALMGGVGSYLRFPLNTGNISSGKENRYVLTNPTGVYTAGGNQIASNSSAANQAYYVSIPVPGVVLPPDTGNGYKIRYTGTGGELDVVYATSDTNALTQGYTPPTPSSWWQAIQHVGFAVPSTTLLVDGTGSPMPVQSGTPDVPVQPRLVVRINSILGASRAGRDNAGMGMDVNYKLRWFAEDNGFRAPILARTKVDTWVTSGSTAAGAGNNENPGNNTFASLMLQDTDTATSASGTTYVYLELQSTPGTYDRYDAYGGGQYFDVPRDDLPLLSLGQLQNANLSLIDGYPAYPFGNSLADFRIANGQTTYLANTIESPGTGNFNQTYYDISWQLNYALWDKYFVSSIPSGGYSTNPSPQWSQSDLYNKVPLPDARMIVIKTSPSINDIVGSNGYDQAAANLMVAGGVNVNSTSPQAWRAVLAGTFNVPYNFGAIASATNPDMATPVNNIQIPRLVSACPNQGFYPGFVYTAAATQKNGTYASNTEIPQNASRYLALQPETLPYVVAKLAQDITNQIKIRGPFLSMADFVNRRLVDTSGTSILAGTGLKGTLQAALDTNTAATANIPGTSVTNAPLSVNPLSYTRTYDMDPTAVPTGSSYSLNNLRGSTSTGQESYKSRQDAGSLLHVTQADLLSLLGPSLFARSDTFTVRAYGEVVNPVTHAIEGRAWCEAVVQRTPDYIDNSTNAWNAPVSGSINATLGRRFIIVSFRWLTPNDI